ncbi:MAG: LPS export ABC transporter permease LptG [Alphaproteobacteria bacterium]|nr:LPS export ABC transporter permease LptG [Alphaproteobacteria bacterium]
MKITPTLSTYLVKNYFYNLVVLMLALLAVIYLFDTVELVRRASNHNDVPLVLVLQMGLLKLPEVGQTLFPFAVLFSAIYTFWQLTRRYELIVIRASGFSVWQFLLPILTIAILIGVLVVAVINPIGAALVTKFEELERIHLKRQTNQIVVFKEGLWLHQKILIEQDNGNPIEDPGEAVSTQKDKPLISGYVILHTPKVQQPDWILHNVTVFYFTDEHRFLQRIDSKTATLQGKNWIFKDVVINKYSTPTEHDAEYILPTNLTISDIEESFSSPETMSFWKLPAYIKTLERTGFDATRLKVYHQHLLSQPLMFAAMILLAATVSMRPPRARKTFPLIMAGVFMGFIIFFMSNFLQTLGTTQQIPPILAAWAPALISFLLGLSVIMTTEDG